MRRTLLSILLIAFCAACSWAQSIGARVQGTVKDGGKPIAGAEVVFTNQDTSTTYKAQTDENGAFQLASIPTGDNYRLDIFNAAGWRVFGTHKLVFNAEAAAPAVLAIDISNLDATNLSAALGNPHDSPEQIAILKAQNVWAQAQNNLTKEALDAMNARRWQEAIAPLHQLIANDPNRYVFYQFLGEAQLNLGHYNEAIQSFEKGIQLANSNAVSDPSNDPLVRKKRVTAMLDHEGDAFFKLKKTDQAIKAFIRATEIDPGSAVVQFNLCVALYNAKQADRVLPACEKAIELDPLRPEPYFIKGALLANQSKRDRDGKLQAPPGAAAALWKYLELAPDGPYAREVKEALNKIGAKVERLNQGTK